MRWQGSSGLLCLIATSPTVLREIRSCCARLLCVEGFIYSKGTTCYSAAAQGPRNRLHLPEHAQHPLSALHPGDIQGEKIACVHMVAGLASVCCCLSP